MATRGAKTERPVDPQSFRDPTVHRWYTTVLGYSDRLVGEVLDRFGVQRGALVLDPFCGTGTTLVECKKRGIDSVGVDANPAAVFASKAKIDWRPTGERLRRLLAAVRRGYGRQRNQPDRSREDPTWGYLERSGMIRRRWIDEGPLLDCIALKSAIDGLSSGHEHRRLLKLALLDTVVRTASNVSFGPELYCNPSRANGDVWEAFAGRVETVAADLEWVRETDQPGRARAWVGDAREPLLHPGTGTVDFVITSPPYPAEHDYTRNTRLELAFLEHVLDRSALRSIKRRMLRSHTKGIYRSDDDGALASSIPSVQRLVGKLEPICAVRRDGFSKLYPKVVLEYFGGMMRHLLAVKECLRSGAKCAYIVGDQASYLRTHIPTADLLADVALAAGLAVEGTAEWRTRWASGTATEMKEHILLLERR